MPFLVVEFESKHIREVSVIPKSWLRTDGKCYWPPYKTDASIFKAKTCEEAFDEETWTTYKVRQLGSEYTTYYEALQKAKTAEDTSNLSEDDGKRKRRKPEKLSYDDKSCVPSTKKSKVASLTRVPLELPAFPVQSHKLVLVGDATTGDVGATVHELSDDELLESGTSGSELGDVFGIDEVLLGQNDSQCIERISSEKPVHIETPRSSRVHAQTSVHPGSSTLNNLANVYTPLADTEFKKMVLTSLALINKKVDNMMILISEKQLSTSFEKTTVDYTVLPKFPITTNEELTSLEVMLGDQASKTNFVLLLSRCGGKTPKAALKLMGIKFADEELLSTYNYNGMRGKDGFKQFQNICSGLAEVLTTTFPSEKFTEYRIAELLGGWLTSVGEKLKKRKK